MCVGVRNSWRGNGTILAGVRIGSHPRYPNIKSGRAPILFDAPCQDLRDVVVLRCLERARRPRLVQQRQAPTHAPHLQELIHVSGPLGGLRLPEKNTGNVVEEEVEPKRQAEEAPQRHGQFWLFGICTPWRRDIHSAPVHTNAIQIRRYRGSFLYLSTSCVSERGCSDYFSIQPKQSTHAEHTINCLAHRSYSDTSCDVCPVRPT